MCHKLPHRHTGSIERLQRGNLAVLKRNNSLVIDDGPHGLHQKEGKNHGQADERLVRRRRLQTEGLPQK